MSSKKSVKILLIGDSGVGKTAILHRFADDVFNPTFISTIGIDFKIKQMVIDGKEIKIQIWDTAGQERFNTLTPSYYRNADGIILVYDVTNTQSLENISSWLATVEENANINIETMLVANKCDLLDQRVISKEDCERYASDNGIDFLEVSAKSGSNVNELFQKIIKGVLAKIPPSSGDDNRKESSVSVTKNASDKKKKGWRKKCNW